MTPTKPTESEDMKVLRNASALLATQTIKQLMASATTNKTTSASSNGGGTFQAVKPYNATFGKKIYYVIF